MYIYYTTARNCTLNTPVWILLIVIYKIFFEFVTNMHMLVNI